MGPSIFQLDTSLAKMYGKRTKGSNASLEILLDGTSMVTLPVHV